MLRSVNFVIYLLCYCFYYLVAYRVYPGENMAGIRIISRDSRPFHNRAEAGRLLAQELVHADNENAIVLGIPYGGLIVAREIAIVLNADLDVFLSRKLGAPGDPELAIGAVTEDGSYLFDEMISSQTGAITAYIEREKNRQLALLTRQMEEYRRIIPKTVLRERFVIIADDGIETGASMRAALRSIRNQGSSYLLAAIPVAPADSIENLVNDADEVVCFRSPPFFTGVGQFYEDFTQVGHEEVRSILMEESDRKVRK